MYLFDTSNYFAAAGIQARTCMHFAECLDGSSKCRSVIYMLSLKPRILPAPGGGPSLYCVTGHEWSSTDLGLFASICKYDSAVQYRRIFLYGEAAACYHCCETWGQQGPQRFGSASPYARWHVLFPCIAHLSQRAPAPIFPAERRVLFTWLLLNFFKAVSVCGAITHFIKTLRAWFYLPIIKGVNKAQSK